MEERMVKKPRRVLLGLVLLVGFGAVTCSNEASEHGRELLDAARGGHVGQLRSLLDNGVSASVTDDAGRTPLHLAAAYGHQLTAQILLDHGADINARDKVGRTPLDEAEANNHSGLRQFLLTKGGSRGVGSPSVTSQEQLPQLKPSLKFKTINEFEKEIAEPAVLLDSKHVCFFAPARKRKEAEIVFGYLTKAYDELYEIVGRHTEYKIAVYAFPKGNPHGWGGTSNCSIEYDDANLDFEQHSEWTKHSIPHVSGYIEEMAHNFVHATKAQFGWEMVGWSIGAVVSEKVAGNPILREQIRQTRERQRRTYSRYVENGFVLPADVPANKCDRVHGWILWECATDYGPNLWRDFFREIRKEAHALNDPTYPHMTSNAVQISDDDIIRNGRYQITRRCFDRLPGLNFTERLMESGISVTTDVKSYHPEEAGWNRRLF
jgi:hypothetical protein